MTQLLVTAVILAALVAVATLPPTAQAAASAASPTCARAGFKAIDANSRVRVLKRERRKAFGKPVLACDKRTGRISRVGELVRGCDSSAGCSGVTHVRLAGRYVAFEEFNEGRDGFATMVVVLDVPRGRFVTRWEAGDYGPGSTVSAAITDLELAGSGSVAWIAGLSSGEPGAQVTYEVRKFDRGGLALLDAGADIEPESLALSRPTLYWTRGGVARSASLE